ncbi:MAG: FAD-dependent oxidoreductase, partial [Pseudomonadota bacterium]
MHGGRPHILVAGAGIIGLWQAVLLLRAGFQVTLCDRCADPSASNASQYAGAMLAPWCEAEASPALVRDLGIRGLAIWQSTYPGVVTSGSLVIAPIRDRSELVRFGKRTDGFVPVDADALNELEPELEGRFHEALFFENEAHMSAHGALEFLLDHVRANGGEIRFGADDYNTLIAGGDNNPAYDIVIDARGLDAQDQLPDLRGVRGERVLVMSRDVRLKRPIRLLHPRH